MRPFSFYTLILLALAWTQGCAWLVAPPTEDGQSRATLDRLMVQNVRLTQFKGLLKAQVETRGRATISGRVAVAAAVPDQLRMEWLGPLGQPLTAMAGNGKTLTILSYADHEYYTLRQTPTVLEKLIHIPIGLEDLLTLLSGRPVVPDNFHAVQAIEGDPSNGLRLKNRWRRTLADVFTGPDGRLTDEHVYDSEGKRLFHIQWRQWQTIQDYSVPRRLGITTSDGDAMDITIHRLIPETNLAPSIFELSRPNP
jgi:hypothetical protein